MLVIRSCIADVDARLPAMFTVYVVVPVSVTPPAAATGEGEASMAANNEGRNEQHERLTAHLVTSVGLMARALSGRDGSGSGGRRPRSSEPADRMRRQGPDWAILPQGCGRACGARPARQ